MGKYLVIVYSDEEGSLVYEETDVFKVARIAELEARERFREVIIIDTSYGELFRRWEKS